MDNVQFGAFVAQLRKDKGLTQKELADLLHVTDKAVSKWETGKGFPDIKQLEPLARALEVSVVELIACERQEREHLTVEEAGQMVTQAMDQSQKATARRYLRLLKWLLVAIAVGAAYYPLCQLIVVILFLRRLGGVPGVSSDVGIIGGADGPTAILVSSANPIPPLLSGVILAVLSVVCIITALRIRSFERKLK